MKDRTAIDTLRGYFYQFDSSILEILNLGKLTDEITIEGIEDIDVASATETTAIQYKYYEKTEYYHSVIAKPIRLMLDHFKEVKDGRKHKVNYKLYGYFRSGQSKLTVPIDLLTLKDKFLTYTEAKTKTHHYLKLSLNDNDLDDFLGLLEVDVNGKEFEEQFREVISFFKRQFNCSEFVAEHFYYNNALRIIKDLSKEHDITERKITKNTFLSKLDTSSILYNEWFILRKGKKAYFSALRKEYFTDLNISPFERFFLIKINEDGYTRQELKEIIFLISKKWAKVHKRYTDKIPHPFSPYIYIHGISETELIELKNDLQNDDFIFSDGYNFLGAQFNVTSIISKPERINPIRIKMINTIQNLQESIKTILKTKNIFQFYLTDPFFNYDNTAVKHIKIKITKLSDIKHII
ncbi:MAG TPA: hypothetical protein ENH35_01605 [Candidatus Moranbacteria bacterium]|nr:hypothetical protein [Candidatus Moranbacteria bacterium]